MICRLIRRLILAIAGKADELTGATPPSTPTDDWRGKIFKMPPQAHSGPNGLNAEERRARQAYEDKLRRPPP